MADYKSNRSCIQDTVKEAVKIFGDNFELQKGFQIFLPENYSLDVGLERASSAEEADSELLNVHHQDGTDLEAANETDGLLRQREIHGSNVKFFLVCTGIWLSVFSLVIYGFVRFILI